MKRKEYDHKYDNFSPISLSSSSSKTRRLDPDLLKPTNYDDPRSCTVSEVAIESLPQQSSEIDNKAIVLYNPMMNTPLYRPPSVPANFSVVVDSDIIPNLKEMVRSLERRESRDDKNWAVVPWVGHTEGEEVEMMDAEDCSEELNEELHQWQQQHCMKPEIFQRNYTPVAW